ncbi:MAG: acyl-CoA dehydrogenase [Deltaproteobacteria bacterium]|nr:acyl-CoA dehydrogenase [Deltaproteobacteria bacterium]
MILFNPRSGCRQYEDARSREIMEKTIAFFEAKGKKQLKADDHQRKWYGDFVEFLKENRIFSTLLTPPAYAGNDPAARWDTWRNCEFNEITSFYGLHYWYTWQVSILGLGPIWMGANEEAKRRAAEYLRQGEVFGLGLSEKTHGADIYSTETSLAPQPGGGYLARGDKYYIGNGNVARMISTFGKMADTGEYVFFASDSQHPNYELIKNIVAVQSYVAGFGLRDYPMTDADVLSRGDAAWNSALNTVNVGKYNLGWASIGICTHALYEAVRHAANRVLYGRAVTEFSHVRRMLIDAYARLVSMKLFALRASDYQRTASAEDRRYLLFNPVVKMKVTTQGEEVINLLWDVIAAKGFEEDTYFEMATRDIRALPKLEGTVHVNIALILKFMANYLFRPGRFPEIPEVRAARHDEFLFNQGAARGLGKVQFHDPNPVFASWDVPNVAIFREQITAFKKALLGAPATPEQMQDVDFMLSVGEIFTTIVYGQLVLESARLHGIGNDLVDRIFDCLVRDVSKFATDFITKPAATDAQVELGQKVIRRPMREAESTDRVWQEVLALKDAYEMNP